MNQHQKPNRYIGDVLQNILDKIPKDEHSFIRQLEGLKSSIAFSPPELIYLRWQTFTDVFTWNVPYPPEKEWHIEVISIFIDKTIDEVKEMFKNNPIQ